MTLDRVRPKIPEQGFNTRQDSQVCHWNWETQSISISSLGYLIRASISCTVLRFFSEAILPVLASILASFPRGTFGKQAPRSPSFCGFIINFVLTSLKYSSRSFAHCHQRATHPCLGTSVRARLWNSHTTGVASSI